MKRLVFLILALCFVFSLVGCSNPPSFDSRDEMFAHLNGVWQNGAGTEYCIVENGVVSTVNESTVVYYLKDYFVEYIKENGYDAYITLGLEDALEAVKPSVLDTYAKDCVVNPAEGTLVLSPGSEFEATLTLTEEGLHGEDVTYTKLSDTVDFPKQFERCFYTAINEYKPKPDDFVLSLNRCAEKLKEYHVEIGSYIAVNDEMWTDTGNASSYSDMLLRPQGGLDFIKKFVGGKYTYSYSPSEGNHTTAVVDTSGRYSLEEMVRDALIFVSDYPLALSESKLVEGYENGSTVGEFGTVEFDISYEGIRYEISERKDGTTIVRIEIL